jgi:hypothetical protein
MDEMQVASSLLRIAFILPKVPNEEQVSLSIYLLSQAYLVPSQVDRYYVLLMCLWVMN